MANAITGIDHFLVAVPELAAAAAGWRRLGFTVTPPGKHIGRKTGNHCIMFQKDYLELLALVDPDAPPSRNEEAIRARGEGLFAAALTSTDAEATHAGLAAAGLSPRPISELRRPVELPDGAGELLVYQVELPHDELPDFRYFICEHRTPELLWHPAWLEHANGVTGIKSATVVSADPPRLAATYEAIFGAGCTTLTDDTLTVFSGRAAVVCVTPDAFRQMYPDADPADPDKVPRGAAIALTVANVDATADCLAANEVPFEVMPDDRLQVAPAHANNVLLQFCSKAGR